MGFKREQIFCSPPTHKIHAIVRCANNWIYHNHLVKFNRGWIPISIVHIANVCRNSFFSFLSLSLWFVYACAYGYVRFFSVFHIFFGPKEMHNTRYCIVLFSSPVRAIVLLENNGKILANINIYIVYHAKRIKWQQKFYSKCWCVCVYIFGYFLHACWANKVLLCQQMVKGFFIVFLKHFIHCEQWPRLFEFHTICRFYSSPCKYCDRMLIPMVSQCCFSLHSILFFSCIVYIYIWDKRPRATIRRQQSVCECQKQVEPLLFFCASTSRLKCILSDYSVLGFDRYQSVICWKRGLVKAIDFYRQFLILFQIRDCCQSFGQLNVQFSWGDHTLFLSINVMCIHNISVISQRSHLKLQTKLIAFCFRLFFRSFVRSLVKNFFVFNPFSVRKEAGSTLMIYGWQINAGMNFGYPHYFLRDIVTSFNQRIVWGA